MPADERGRRCAEEILLEVLPEVHAGNLFYIFEFDVGYVHGMGKKGKLDKNCGDGAIADVMRIERPLNSPVRECKFEIRLSPERSDTSRHPNQGALAFVENKYLLKKHIYSTVMGLLNHLLSSKESIAREIEADEEAIVKHWKHYLSTIPQKKYIIEQLKFGRDFQNNLRELMRLFKLELIDISDEEKEESELISDLEAIEHSQKIKRVHKLEQCLGYAETKFEYVYGLLHQLHSILKSQMHLIMKLQMRSKDSKKLILHLKSLFELESELLNKIEKIETFHSLFLALIKGEHIIRTMDDREKRLLKKMQKGIGKIFSNEITEGITYDWAMTVFGAIEDKVHEGVANGMFPGYHPDIDFEFANRPEFVNLVRESIQNVRKRKVSEQIINVFVHVFREWYNHERE